MLTSSFNEEDVGSCDEEYLDGISDGECASSPKPATEGTFERLISSQREFQNRHGARIRSDGEENFEKLFGFQDYHGPKQCRADRKYDEEFKLSMENPAQFWSQVGRRLSWFKPWDKILDDSDPPFTKWFVGGMLNACYNAVDRHVENGLGERVALIHDSPVTSSIRRITYSQLLQKVSLLAGVYSSIGVNKGDRVLIYMPMIPEAIIAMLATARLGAIHSVVFGGFAARELQTRIDHVEPSVIVAANCGVEPNKIVRYRSILKEALQQSSYKPSHIIIYERPEIKLEGEKHDHMFGEGITELDWQDALNSANHTPCVPVEANEPLYILYTSGTTDQPKGVVRPVGGHLATLAWTMNAVYGMGCPHNYIRNSSSSKNENFDLQHQKLPCDDMNHEPHRRDVNKSSYTEGCIHHKEIITGNITSFLPNRGAESNDASTCNHLVNGDDRKYTSKVMPPGNENLMHNPRRLQELSANASQSNFCYKPFLNEFNCESKNQSAGTDSLQNCLTTNQSHHGLKHKEKEQKSHPVHFETDSLSNQFAHNSISSVQINDKFCNHKDEHKEGCISRGCILNKNAPSKVINETEGKQKISNHHKNEPTSVSRNLVRHDIREQKQSVEIEKDGQNPANHFPGHAKCGVKSCNLHEKHKEILSEHRAGKTSEEKPQFNHPVYTSNCNSTSESKHYQRCPNDKGVWWAASDMGWVVGHSYVCYAPLTAGLTSVMYEGKPDRTPDPGQYFRVIEEHGVNALLTAPTALRVIKRVDPNAIHGKKYSTKSLKTIFVAGESLDQSTKTWAERTFKVGVVNHWWQTETGHSITATFLGLNHSPNDPPGLSTGKSCPGFNLRILRDDGSEAAVGEEGRIAARLPLPPGTLSTLYKNPEQFKLLYFSTFPGYYDTMDAGYIVPDANSSNGWIVVTGREDDVVSVAGHRLSAAAIEAVALQHPDVCDALVVGIPDCTKGEVPLCLYVPTPKWKKNGESDDSAAQRVSTKLFQMVRELVGPIAAFHLAFPVPALPKTRSGKIPRRSIARMARGLPLKIPSTVEDPLVYEEIKAVLQTMNLSQVK
ncbi:acyl-CoA synthetase short-chain family member 3, mitochondrial [Ischnura elegans]|uniref:acyl-CoA synthetase short-chain family member 3, mitochondrial n=1 Tax=Ischnura elegans TaxID=197161 RepID=UPI001ED8808B|nr:acyl-CoA synthetase short-chain family member 3, mitochondrial [Ischnura elegans]